MSDMPEGPLVVPTMTCTCKWRSYDGDEHGPGEFKCHCPTQEGVPDTFGRKIGDSIDTPLWCPLLHKARADDMMKDWVKGEDE